MKVFRTNVIITILTGFIVVAIMHLTWDYLQGIHNKKERLEVITFFSVGVVIFIMAYLWIVWPSKPAVADDRPLVRAWTEDSIIALCTDEDFRGLHAENVDAAIAWIEKRPMHMGFFSNSLQKRALLGPYLTGSVADFHALVAGCRVESTKLFIPREPIEAGQISTMTLKEMRERIYGTSPDYEFRD